MILSAAGSHPGDLHKLWRTRTPNGYHMEYGYSCMGYEIPGGLGAKMADPSREVYVFIGDGTYLMMPTEIVTSVQQGIKIIIVLVDNKGFGSIGSLSRSLGRADSVLTTLTRSATGQLDGELLQVDFAANARSLGAHALKATTLHQFKDALEQAKSFDRTTVIVVETDPARRCRAMNPGGMWLFPSFHMESVREAQCALRRSSQAGTLLSLNCTN